MFLPLLRRLVLVAAPLSTFLAGAAMAGDVPSEAQLSAARALFMAAEKDEDADRWSDALEKLQRVAQVKLTAGIRYHTALCEEHLGRLIAALGDYKAAASAAQAEHASDVLRLVERRVVDSTERIPNVVIVIPPTLPGATVSLDGRPIVTGVPVSADPGTHTIDARAPGCAPSMTTVVLQERDATRVEVDLEPVAPPRAVAATEAREPAPPAPTNASASRDRTLAIVAAAGAVGLAAGGLGAYLAAGREHSDAVLECAQVLSRQAGACDSRKNAVRAWDWVGVGAWAGAAAVGTVAIARLVRSLHEASHAGGDRTGSRLASPSARVMVGPASIGLEGAF